MPTTTMAAITVALHIDTYDNYHNYDNYDNYDNLN